MLADWSMSSDWSLWTIIGLWDPKKIGAPQEDQGTQLTWTFGTLRVWTINQRTNTGWTYTYHYPTQICSSVFMWIQNNWSTGYPKSHCLSVGYVLLAGDEVPSVIETWSARVEGGYSGDPYPLRGEGERNRRKIVGKGDWEGWSEQVVKWICKKIKLKNK